MVGVEDLDSYGKQNDIRPEDPAPREPEGQPDYQTDDLWVWQFDPEGESEVDDTYVVAKDPSPLDFRMWVFAGHGPNIHFIMRASHRYSENERIPDDEVCCEVLMDGQSLRGSHCPAVVEETVADLTDADVIMPKPVDDDHGGPISY